MRREEEGKKSSSAAGDDMDSLDAGAKSTAAPSAATTSTSRSKGPSVGSEPKTQVLSPLRELKPLPSSSKALPSITGSSPLPSLSSLGEKKKLTEEALRRNQEELAEQRKQEEQLRSKVNAGVDQEEVERRAQHMRMQRERLLAQKKAARDEKVFYCFARIFLRK